MCAMPDPAELTQQKCPACGTLITVGETEPLTRIECPQCGEKFRVERAFDNFVIVETLGVGGMGSVYKARDTRLDRFVALKVLRKELSTDPAEAARLEQEARMTAAVNHPNAIQVYSAGTAHGQVYLVMELVDHGSLDDLMAQKTRVPEVQVLRAGIQVARGLQAAHEKGLIHRDVKPANILFADEQTAKIGDFGLAGAAEQTAEGRKEIWGTPYYVAPERLNNEPEDLRSDIYSLGATLFHAIAGKPPMEGETTSASELRELKSHPPDLCEVAPDVSAETAHAINRMIAPNPEDRFSTYQELIDELVAAYGEVSGTAKKTPRWLIPAAVLCFILIAISAYVFYQRSLAKVRSAAGPTMSQQQAALQTHFSDARRLIVDGKYDAAVTGFTKLAIEAGTQQPEANWARLHTGFANLLQGKIGPARDAFQLVEKAAAFSTKKEAAELVNFFTTTSRTLSATTPVRENTTTEINPKSVGAFAFLLFGLKDWQLREFTDGGALVQRFLASIPPNEFNWMNDYKPLAKKFADDASLYNEWKNNGLTNANDLSGILAKLKTLQGKVQTHAPLSEYFKEEERRLTATAAQREKDEKDKQAAENEKRAHDEKDRFEAEKPKYLADWKQRLIADLKTGAYKTPVTIGPTTYQGVKTANDNMITLNVANYGEAPFGWEKFPPNMLLTMSLAFVRPNAPDAADRQWLAAVYAFSIGQLDAAKTLSDSAAKAKSDYARLRDLLLAKSP